MGEVVSDLRNKTIRGLFWGGMSSLAQQALGLLFSIIIARRLSPEDYGIVGMLAIFTALATVLQESGFVFIITNRKTVTKEEYSTIFWFNITMSGFIYMLLFWGTPLIADFYNTPELTALSRYVFLGFFISSLGVVQTAYLYKNIKVKERTIAMVIALLISGIVGVVMAYNGFCYWGIATQAILNVFISTLMLWVLSPFRPVLRLDFKFLAETLPDGVRFSLPNMFTTISNNVFSVLLGRLYSSVEVGNYSQALKWNTYGCSLTLGMLRNVSQPVLVQVKDDKEKTLLVFRKILRMTCFLTMPILFGLAMVAPELITILLTEKWLGSSRLLQILCVGGIFSTLTTLCSFFIMSQNWTKLYMYLGIMVSVFYLTGAFVASFWGSESLAFSYSGVSVISFFVYHYFIRKSHEYKYVMLVKDVMPVLLGTLGVLLLVFFATKGIDSIYMKFIARVAVSAISYIIAMSIIKFDSFEEIKKIISKKICNG